MRVYGLAEKVGRRRRPEPPVVVTLVVAGEEFVLPPDHRLGKAMGQLAAILAHW